MISYAQNREDVLLNRVFRDIRNGYYVDVGAGHPDLDSVTRWFSEQGWRGINIEPRLDMFKLLAARRPRDVNLNIALSNQTSRARFFHVDVPEVIQGDGGALSTMDVAIAEKHRTAGRTVTEIPIVVETLTEVLGKHHQGEIDFLKIDVEGLEQQVIEGLDWKRYRPRVVVVESTLPQTTVSCHAVWEPLLLNAGYLYAAFDGLNRYYVRVEDQVLVKLLEVPVNVLDDYVCSQVVALRGEIANLKKQKSPWPMARWMSWRNRKA